MTKNSCLQINKIQFLLLTIIVSIGLNFLIVSPTYAQASKSNLELTNISKNLEEKATSESSELQAYIYQQLVEYQQRTLVPGFTFFFAASVGASAFPIKSVENELKDVSSRLVEDLNAAENDVTKHYRIFNKTYTPPFFLSMDFRVFYSFFGFGASYDYYSPIYGNYSIGVQEDERDGQYDKPIELLYEMSGHGMGFYAYLHRSIFVPQINIVFGVGYSFNIATAKVALNAEDSFARRSTTYKSTGHGVKGLIELLIVYKHLTYGFGILIDGTSYDDFDHNSKKLVFSNGTKASVGMLNSSPLFYVRIGTRF